MLPVYLVSFRPVFESKNRSIVGVFVSLEEARRVFRSLPVDLDPSLLCQSKPCFYSAFCSF